MAHDYNALLKELYDEFGEDAVRFVKTKLVDQMQNGSARQSRTVNAEETETGPEHDGGVLRLTEEPCENDPEHSIYFDADRFEQRHMVRTHDGLLAAGTATDVLKAFNVLVEGAVEVAKFEEAQTTVRTGIAARRDIALAQIENQKTLLLAYLDKSFDERKENFEKLFSVLDHALDSNNMEELGLGLQSIIQLAESSPFKDLASLGATAAALEDPDHEWDF